MVDYLVCYFKTVFRLSQSNQRVKIISPFQSGNMILQTQLSHVELGFGAAEVNVWMFAE